MDYNKLILELSKNIGVFRELLTGVDKEEYLWKVNPDNWCLLEIICHLYDEEREDFRARTKHVLESPELPLPPIDPTGWVEERNYIQQDYPDKLQKFLEERKASIAWLQSLVNPQWGNAFNHPKFGKMTGKMFLSNWAAHDYLHIRQIIKLKFNFLQHISDEPLNYAGDW